MKLHDKMVLKREFSLEDENGKEMAAIDVFSAAILYLKDDILKTLKRKSPGVTNIYWVLTVPAIWTEPAKQFMIKAAEKAGIQQSQLSLCLEPEAAAIYCKTLPDGELYDSKDEEVIECFKPGGKYIVLDLGGGTVDTAVHEVREDGSLTEIEKSSGGGWGGTQVDKEFKSYISRTYGDCAITALKTAWPREWFELLNEFENRKRCTKCSEDKYLRLKLPAKIYMNSTIKVKNQTVEHLYVHYNDFVSFFKKTVQKIAMHIKEILSRNTDIKLILMVGGFAESEYVRCILINTFKDKRILVPHGTSVAVLKGAVLYGFAPTAISARVCRFTYGVQVNVDFKEGTHRDDYRDIVDGDIVCRNVFKVLAREGETIGISNTKSYQLHSTHKEENRRHIDMCVKIFASKNKNVLYTTEDGCTRIGEVFIHPPKSGWSSRVDCTLQIEFGRTEFHIQVRSEGDQDHDLTCEFLQ